MSQRKRASTLSHPAPCLHTIESHKGASARVPVVAVASPAPGTMPQTTHTPKPRRVIQCQGAHRGSGGSASFDGGKEVGCVDGGGGLAVL